MVFQGVSQFEACRRFTTPRRRGRRTPLRLREDPQLCYADNLRQSVDNDIRYKQTSDQQQSYRQILGNLFYCTLNDQDRDKDTQNIAW